MASHLTAPSRRSRVSAESETELYGSGRTMTTRYRFTRSLAGCIALLLGLVFAFSQFPTTLSAESAANPQAPTDDLRIIVTPEEQAVVAGDAAVFTVLVLNTSSNVNLKNVSVVSAEVPDCNRSIGNLAADDNFPPYQCSRQNTTTPFTGSFEVSGRNVVNNQKQTASVQAKVDVVSLNIQATAAPNTLPEPGGDVTFNLSLTNTGSLDLNLNGFSSPQFGNLLDGSNSAVADNTCPSAIPSQLADDDTVSCSFTARVSAQPGAYNASFNANAATNDDLSLSASGNATITLTDVASAMSVTLSAPQTVAAPSGTVAFQLRIDNDSAVDAITVNSLNDSRLGSVKGAGSCDLSQPIGPGEHVECSYSAELSGQPGTTRTHTLTVSAEDDDTPPNILSQNQTVTITMVDPPSYVSMIPAILSTSEADNDECGDAYPLATNLTYYFMPEDLRDWFWFELDSSQTVSVELRQFTPGDGNLNIYKGSNCQNLTNALANNGDTKPTKIINLGTLQAGRYYVLLISVGPLSAEKPYELIIKAN